MATFSQAKPATNNSDANFRLWVKAIIDGLIAVGLVRVTATGEIDETTVTAPASSTVGGFVIFRLDDALQATSPYFFKIEFGTGSTTSNPQLWVTVGHIHDGAGTLTLGTGQGAVVRHTLYAAAGAANSATTPNISISGSTSRFGVCLWQNGGGNRQSFFGFERSKDNAGADTDEYGTLLMSAANSSTLLKQYTLPKNGTSLGSPGTESSWLFMTTTLTSSSFNNKKALSEVKPMIGKFGNPMTIAIGLKAADWVTDGEVFTGTMYGVSRTFMVISGIYTAGTGNITLIAMRWE
jgi:hypothetical protein